MHWLMINHSLTIAGLNHWCPHFELLWHFGLTQASRWSDSCAGSVPLVTWCNQWVLTGSEAPPGCPTVNQRQWWFTSRGPTCWAWCDWCDWSLLGFTRARKGKFIFHGTRGASGDDFGGCGAGPGGVFHVAVTSYPRLQHEVVGIVEVAWFLQIIWVYLILQEEMLPALFKVYPGHVHVHIRVHKGVSMVIKAIYKPIAGGLSAIFFYRMEAFYAFLNIGFHCINTKWMGGL